MDRYRKVIASQVLQRIEAERPRIVEANGPHSAEVTLGPVEYQIVFVKNCKGAAVTVDYAWKIKRPATNETTTQRKRRLMGCMKLAGMWICS